jgi:hypothetical protein
MSTSYVIDDVTGRLELLALRFPGVQFSREILCALSELVDRGSVRVVDLVFASKSATGHVRTLDLADLDARSFAALEPLVDDMLGVLTEEDAASMGRVLPNGTSAGLLLVDVCG